MRIWFNKTFSSIHCVMDLIHQSEIGKNTVIASHTQPDAIAFKKADVRHIEPEGLVGQKYVDWCVDFCLKHNVDVFWPGKEAILIGEQKECFTAIGVHVVSAGSPDVLELLENKDVFYNAMRQKGIMAAEYREFTDRDSFLSGYQALKSSFERLCVKPAVGVFGVGFRVIDESRDGFTHIMDNIEYHINYNEFVLGLAKRVSIPKMLVMEYLDGAEWSVDCAALNGFLIGAIQRKKLNDKSHYQVIDDNIHIAEVVSRLTQEYQLNGIFNVQFKEGARGICILEINARPSGGTGKACTVGINLPDLFLKHFMAGSSTQEIKVEHEKVQQNIKHLKNRKVSDIAEPYLL